MEMEIMIIRKKGKWANGEPKYVIEDKGKYIKTLPAVQELMGLLCLEKASCPIKEEKKEIKKKAPETSVNIDYTNQTNKTENDRIRDELNKLGVLG